MDAGPTASIPITRPHLPPMERFSEVVADLFASRLLSSFPSTRDCSSRERPPSSTIPPRFASRAATSA